jgi:hypothetical protein
VNAILNGTAATTKTTLSPIMRKARQDCRALVRLFHGDETPSFIVQSAKASAQIHTEEQGFSSVRLRRRRACVRERLTGRTLERSCENRREPAGSLIAPVGALQPPIPFSHHGNEQMGQQPYPHSYVIEPWRGMCRQIFAGKFQCPGLGPTPPSDDIPLARRCDLRASKETAPARG